jgi:hypothetical protein
MREPAGSVIIGTVAGAQAMRTPTTGEETHVREIVGFVMGAAAGAAGALFVSSKEGRDVIDRVVAEARPDVDRAATEWEPVLREVVRAVRLAAREVETATADLRSRLAEIAAEPTGVDGDATRPDAAAESDVSASPAPAGDGTAASA